LIKNEPKEYVLYVVTYIAYLVCYWLLTF